jgi:hypothetical protein
MRHAATLAGPGSGRIGRRIDPFATIEIAGTGRATFKDIRARAATDVAEMTTSKGDRP